MLHIVTRAKQAPLPSMEPGKLFLRKEELSYFRCTMRYWPDTLIFSLALRLCTSSIAGEREEKCGEIHKTFFFSRHRSSSSYAHPVTQVRYPDK